MKKITFLKYYWINSYLLLAFSVAIEAIMFIINSQGNLDTSGLFWSSMVLLFINLVRFFWLIPGYKRI